MMEGGMLWYDGSPEKLAVKIEKAAKYYAQKYGQFPNLCLVNQQALEAEPVKTLNLCLDVPVMFEAKPVEELDCRQMEITVRSHRSILPGHLWIGVRSE